MCSKFIDYINKQSEIDYRGLSSLSRRRIKAKNGIRTKEEFLEKINKTRRERGLDEIYPERSASLLKTKSLLVLSDNEARIIKSLQQGAKDLEEVRAMSKLRLQDFEKAKSSLLLKKVDLKKMTEENKKRKEKKFT